MGTSSEAGSTHPETSRREELCIPQTKLQRRGKEPKIENYACHLPILTIPTPTGGLRSVRQIVSNRWKPVTQATRL